MGQKYSALKVTSGLRLQGDCGMVDGIKLSYSRNSCWCWKRRRLLAAFTFHGKETGLHAAAQVATIKLDRLMKKDGETPVTVTCFAGGTRVFEKEMPLADLLRALKCTARGNQAALYFCLVGEKKGSSQAYTALFCNGKRVGDGDIAGRSGGVLRQARLHPEADFQDALDQVSTDPEDDFQDALDQVSQDPEDDFQDALDQDSTDSEADLDVESLGYEGDLESASLDSETDPEEISLDYDADLESDSQDSDNAQSIF